MDDIRPDVAETIFHFLEGLPTTIRPDILLFVMMYGLDICETNADVFLPNIREALLGTRGMKRMSATIRVVGATDHVLYRATVNIRRAKTTMEAAFSPGDSQRERFSAGQPLRKRHYDKAFADWTKLRTTLINREGLADYEDYLLRPHLAR
jgi:hypothetical protein